MSAIGRHIVVPRPSGRVGPQPLEVVVATHLLEEDVHDEVAEVDQHPLRLTDALDAQRARPPGRLHLRLDLLGDGGLVAGDGEAAKLVSYIRTDESPHVEYLRTTLSEMRDRSFVGESGRVYDGAELIGRLWDRALSQSLGPRRKLMKQTSAAEVERAVRARPDAGDLLDEFHRLES